MNIGRLLLAIVAFHDTLASAFDCSPRCPGYETCLEGNRRDLAGSDFGLLEDGRPSSLANDARHAAKTNLRGRSSEPQKRHLEDYNFQLKLFWQEGYCWQEEWDERHWCLTCQDDCDEDEYLWLKECDQDNEEQFFEIEWINQTIGAMKLMPKKTASDPLCWTRTRENAHQLKPCGTDYLDNVTNLDMQVLIGFQETGRFELHPNGYDETNPYNVTKCMNSQHHPKNEEIVRAEFCELGRANKNTKWIVLNPGGSRSDSGTDGAGVGDEGDGNLDDEEFASNSTGFGPGPDVQGMSGSYCSEEEPCPHCYGDCDTDEDCIGDLVCFKRDAGGQPVPSCSGGEETTSDFDFCIDPNWESVQTTPTTAPTGSTTAPTVATTASPTGSTSEPTASTTAPTASTPSPTESTTAPTGSTPSPTVSTTAPTGSTPTPTVSTSAPTGSTSAPTASTTAPTASTPSPTESTPSPTGSTPSPTESTTAPTGSTPFPTVSTTAATGSTSAPTTSTTSPAPPVLPVNGTTCTPSNPCPHCYGDCDVDEDCQEGLVCFQRNSFEPVPSCRFGELSMSSTDYCIDPNWDIPTGGSSATESPTTSPTQATTSVPSEETSPAPTEEMTLAPTEATSDPVGVTSSPTAEPTKAEDIAAEEDDVLPMLNAVDGDYCSPDNQCDICNGDCDTDDDCQTGLICFQRERGDSVPGCAGEDPSRTDYCILKP